MRRIGRGIAASVALAAVLAACGGGEERVTANPDPASEVLAAPGATRAEPAADAPVDEAVAGMNAFAAELYRAADVDDNLVFSPLSIAYAFAMLRAGANGNTAAELDEAFGFPPGVAEAFNALSGQLVAGEVPPANPGPAPEATEDPAPSEPVLAIANALFTQAGYEYRPEFLRTLTEQYGSGLRAVDFAGPAAVDAINAWAAENTAGRITQIFKELDPDTRLVLANAVFLDADWKVPFDAAGEQEFAVESAPVEVPMMAREFTAGYAQGANWRAVELPYFGDRFAMRVILPTGDATPVDVLRADVLAAAGRTKPTLVDVTLPTWDFGSDLNLVDLLPALGVTDVFQPGSADLSGITATEALYAGQALHKATITVDELGTVASAVTAISAEVTSAQVPPPQPFRVDRPFGFAIVDTETGAPLFLGQVSDPRA